MKDWVKEKLNIIEKLYPPERINKSKERLRRAWNNEKQEDRAPFVCWPALFDPYAALLTPEQRLRYSLDEIIVRGYIQDDFIPSIFPGCRQTTIATMFGAKEYIIDNHTACDRIINTYADIDLLPKASMADGTVARMWLDMEEYLLEETEGRLPIHVTDMQGPIDASAQMIGYDDLFICAYEEPDRFHHLMSMVSDAFIELWKAQEKLLGDKFIGTHIFAWNWVPPGLGATMSIDSLVMISPDFYEEFFKPYVERISDTFGGVSVHSCGNFSSVIPNLCKTRGLKGINSSQMTLKQIVDAGVTKDVVSIVITPYEELEETVRVAKESSAKMILTIKDVWPPEEGRISKPMEAWTSEDKRNIKIFEENIHLQLEKLK